MLSVINAHLTIAVCGAPQCAATPSRHLVRGAARVPPQEYDGSDDAGGSAGRHVSGIQHHIHDGTNVQDGSFHEKTVCQVHMSLSLLRLLPL